MQLAVLWCKVYKEKKESSEIIKKMQFYLGIFLWGAMRNRQCVCMCLGSEDVRRRVTLSKLSQNMGYAIMVSGIKLQFSAMTPYHILSMSFYYLRTLSFPLSLFLFLKQSSTWETQCEMHFHSNIFTASSFGFCLRFHSICILFRNTLFVCFI